jgi:hypothetical protein
MTKDDRFSLIERSAMTFDSFLRREFASRFYTDEFLTGISQRRLEVRARIGKSAGWAFLFATTIAFFDLIAGSNVSYIGISVQITQDIKPIVALLAAAAFVQSVFALIDDQIIFRILMKLGSNIGIHSFPLLLVDKAAIDLWGDSLTLRYFGPRSGIGQKIAVIVIGLIIVIGSTGLQLFAPAMVGLVAFQVFFDPNSRTVALFISGLACVIVIWGLVLGLVFVWRFKFEAADWIESTNIPTEEFAARMRAELGSDGDIRDNPNTDQNAH